MGGFRCIDASSGETKWTAEMGRYGVGSLIAVGDKLVCLAESGAVRVVAANPDEYVEHSAADLPRAVFYAAPTFSRGRLYARNHKGDVYCIDMR